MNTELFFFIPGHPAPGGSKSAFPVWRGNGTIVTRKLPNGKDWPILRMVDAGGKANEVWKATCAVAARGYMRGAKPYTQPIKVEFIFFIRRPLHHYRTGKNAHMLRDGSPKYHVTTPDALKFARSTEDALTGVIWHDDSQTVCLRAEKRYMGPDDREGCAVRFIVLDSDAPKTLPTTPQAPELFS